MVTKAADLVKSVTLGGKGKVIMSDAARRIFDRVEDLIHSKAVRKISARIGKDPVWVAKRVRRLKDTKAIRGAVDNINLKRMGKLGGKVFIGAQVVVGADLLADWYALDNVIGGSKFRIINLVSMAEDGYITPDVAHEIILEQMETLEIAEGYVKASSKWNPVAWVARRLWAAGMEGDKAAIDDQLIRLQGVRASLLEQEKEEKQAEAEMGGMRGIMQTGEEDPERRAAVMLEASAAKEREEAERERRRNQRTTSGTGRPTRTEGSESPRPQARSKLGFGI